MSYYIPVTMPGGTPCGPPVEIPSQMLLAWWEANSLREQLARVERERDEFAVLLEKNVNAKMDALKQAEDLKRERDEARAEVERKKNELGETRDGKAYSDAKLTEHAEAVGVDPDHIDFIDETTKAIIQMWADNSKLKATNAEQFRLYCEETKKHNETAAKLAALAAECESLRADKEKALPADLGTWTSTIRWMLNVSEERPYTQAATLFDKVGDTDGVPHRGHLEALWSWLDELGGRLSGATGTPTYKIPYEIRNSMEHLHAKLQRTIDRELDRQAKPAARADAARKEPPAKAHGCEVGE